MAKVVKQVVQLHEYVVTLDDKEFALIATLIGRVSGYGTEAREIVNTLWGNGFNTAFGSSLYNQFTDEIKGGLTV